MFDSQISTLTTALSFLPMDLQVYCIALIGFMLLTAVFRIFWR